MDPKPDTNHDPKTKSSNARTSQKDLTSPKRSVTERNGLHAWHPYYAGFSEGFVEDILLDLKVPQNGIVFDPMNGSGIMPKSPFAEYMLDEDGQKFKLLVARDLAEGGDGTIEPAVLVESLLTHRSRWVRLYGDPHFDVAFPKSP